MYCTHCGKEVRTDAAYCSSCGGAQPGTEFQRRLIRPRAGRKIAGVCLGVAHYLKVDPTLVRVIWLLALFLPPSPGLLAYIICWIAMPNEEVAPVMAPMAPAQQPSQTQGG